MGNISHTVFEKKINDFKFLGNNDVQSALAVLRVQVSCTRHTVEHKFSQNIKLWGERQQCKKNLCYTNLSQFNEMLKLSKKDRRQICLRACKAKIWKGARKWLTRVAACNFHWPIRCKNVTDFTRCSLQRQNIPRGGGGYSNINVTGGGGGSDGA